MNTWEISYSTHSSRSISSRNQDVDYCIPEDGNKDAYMDSIETLPLANTPKVFGLHSNAEIGYFTHAAKDMWSQLIELQPRSGETGSGISREEFIGNIASDIQVCNTYPMYIVIILNIFGTYIHVYIRMYTYVSL